MKRRNFIILSSSVVILIGSTYWFFNDFKLKDSIEYPKYLSNILDNDSIISIGLKYIRMFPEHNNKGQLLNLINRDVKVYSNLNDSIKKDFEKGNTLVLNGWILSITEARQCALFSIGRK